MITRELKIGDKVRCIKESPCADIGDSQLGKEFIFEGVSGHNVYTLRGNGYWRSLSFNTLNEYYELVEEEKSNNNMKHKVGDKVRVKPIEWYNENKDESGNIWRQGALFNEAMSHFCGKEVIITNINDSYYIINGLGSYSCTDDMFEEDSNDVEKTLFKQEDNVNHPSHYAWLKDLCGVEVIDITRHMDFNLGNAIKYILRCGHKSEQGMTDKEKTIEDLKKADFYIKDKIKMLEETK